MFDYDLLYRSGTLSAKVYSACILNLLARLEKICIGLMDSVRVCIDIEGLHFVNFEIGKHNSAYGIFFQGLIVSQDFLFEITLDFFKRVLVTSQCLS